MNAFKLQYVYDVFVTITDRHAIANPL